MNTLLGELATLNDVQFHRYRVAFKFRKLQKSLLLEHGDVGMLSEVLHLTGMQQLHHEDTIPLSQLSTVLSELYGAIRTSRPILKQAQVQQAQDWAYNWLQMAYKCGSGGKVQATHLKITLSLFLGSKVTDKARFVFTQLANTNGAIERGGLRMFLHITRQLANALQEDLYYQYQSLDTVFQESLVFVRSSEDVEDEELDGGIRRQWLSQFEFTSLLTSNPPPAFFNWLHLFFQLPSLEKVVHPVRCALCARKPIISFRYQCVQCHNFNMCQMCFLKGRTSERHQSTHQALEFANNGRSNRSWHHRLLWLPHRGNPMGGKMVTDKKEPFSFRPTSRASHSSNEETDVAVTAITDMISTSQMSPDNSVFSERKETHRPAMIRIGSDGKPAFSPKKEAPAAHTLQTSPAHRGSYTSSSSSPDSVSSGGGKFTFDGVSRSSSGSAGVRLSMEVDQILMDLPPPPQRLTQNSHTRPFPSITLSTNHFHDNRSLESDLQGIHKEEEQLQVQVSQLTDKREKLSHDLQDLISQVQQMQVGFQTLGRGSHTSSWARLNTPTSYHFRSESAPITSPSPPSSPESSLPPLAEEQPEVQLRKKKREVTDRATVYTPPLVMATTFDDPLAEYQAGEAAVSGQDSNPDQRFSVAW